MTNVIKLTIGGKTARSRFGVKEVEIDFDTLPVESQAFLVQYGLKQYIADGTAGAEDQTDFDNGISERLDNLKSGEFKRRTGEKGPSDDVGVVAMQLARAELKTALKAKNAKLDKDKMAEVLKAFFAKNEERFRKDAEKEIANRNKLADAVDLSEFGL